MLTYGRIIYQREKKTVSDLGSGSYGPHGVVGKTPTTRGREGGTTHTFSLICCQIMRVIYMATTPWLASFHVKTNDENGSRAIGWLMGVGGRSLRFSGDCP